MARVRRRGLRRFVFGAAKPRRKRRASGVANRVKNAPQHCKTSLGSCMRGGGGAKRGCMKKFWTCIKAS